MGKICNHVKRKSDFSRNFFFKSGFYQDGIGSCIEEVFGITCKGRFDFPFPLLLTWRNFL